ncbi:MAG: hypothetical protein IPK32_05745 [Verrucomicrobiaceae bacterium]|nr:hypothetical protein [Verrucomicrobiaceae bacterium]
MSLTPHSKPLHFGCGFLFGIGIATLIWLISMDTFTSVPWLPLTAVGFITATLAMFQGETFWSAASSIISTLSTWSGKPPRH